MVSFFRCVTVAIRAPFTILLIIDSIPRTLRSSKGNRQSGSGLVAMSYSQMQRDSGSESGSGFDGGGGLMVGLAPQACSSCRRQKRRCDKLLPQCSLCARWVPALCGFLRVFILQLLCLPPRSCSCVVIGSPVSHFSPPPFGPGAPLVRLPSCIFDPEEVSHIGNCTRDSVVRCFFSIDRVRSTGISYFHERGHKLKIHNCLFSVLPPGVTAWETTCISDLTSGQ